MVKYSCKTYLSAVKVWHLSRLDLIDMERLKLQYIILYDSYYRRYRGISNHYYDIVGN